MQCCCRRHDDLIEIKTKFADILIVDAYSHHYENESFSDIVPFMEMENEVLKHLALAHGMRRAGSTAVLPSSTGYQDIGGRVTRYPLCSSERTTAP
jgi:hypothetical protein